jgi:hypothetical protein
VFGARRRIQQCPWRENDGRASTSFATLGIVPSGRRSGQWHASWNELVTDSTRERYFRGTADSEWETLLGMRRRAQTSVLEETTSLQLDCDSSPLMATTPPTRAVSFPQLVSADLLDASQPACSLLLLARVLSAVSTLSPLVVLLEQAQNADEEFMSAMVSLLESTFRHLVSANASYQ